MEQKLLTMFARTPVCVGAGSSVGAIDLPIMRERHTRIPIIPGSSVKGVLRDLWNTKDADGKIVPNNEQQDIFGDGTKAGNVMIGEARVLAFPVRSARGMFAWVTSPLALERFKRDSNGTFNIPSALDTMQCLAPAALCFKEKRNAVFEEYCFEQTGSVPEDILNAFAELSDDPVWQSVKTRLAVISDDMFSYFVENACEIPARIAIDDTTGVTTGGALFYQEQVPSETLFYNVVNSGKEEIFSKFIAKISEAKVLQFGGDETIGLGYCSVKIQ